MADWYIDNDIPFRYNFPELKVSTIDTPNEWVTVEERKILRFDEVPEWRNLISREDIWFCDDNIYYSRGSVHYVLNKETLEWSQKTWYGLSKFRGVNIWSDGSNVYYSPGSSLAQYVLNKSTSTWNKKTWNGFGGIEASNVWSDGSNVYYSYGSTQQYVLDIQTSTWTEKTWNGLTEFAGSNIWSDGSNVYYSAGSTQYVLNAQTSTWTEKTWNGLTSFNGSSVWNTDGYIYCTYPNGTSHYPIYELNISTSTWEEIQWYSTVDIPGLTTIGMFGSDEWSVNNTSYFSPTFSGSGFNSYSATMSIEWATKTPYRIEFPELKDSIDPSHFWYIDDDIPFQGGFPLLKESQSLRDEWLIDDDIPYRLDFQELLESIEPPSPTFWLQYAGYVPYRPWPGKIQIPNIAQTVEIPEIDWTKSMQQTFEYFTVDPKTWYDDKQLFQIISSNHSIDLTSDLRGSATISTNELLGENYIRTYMVCKQGRYTHRICLGTYLYMTSDDSFNGIVHTYTMTGYTPLVELQESMPPIGFFIYGQIKKGDEAPLITDEIKKAILENTRCELEMNVTIPKPLLNNFVAGTDDNWLTVVNNLLTASNEARYMLTVDEWGTLQLKNSPIVSNMQPTFVYDDSNSSILLPEINTGDDLFQIPNTVELIFVGNTRFRPCRKIAKNEDEASPVSVQNRGREIVKRYTISNIAIPVSSTPTQEMIEEMIENQAYTLLETASTIQKTISYSHGYCGTKVGDCVMINYERAGLLNVKAVITSQKINCTPGCQVDETASYTKKYFKRN